MQQFLSRLGDRVTGVLHGFDRLLFRGTQRMLANRSGLSAFLAMSHVLLKDFASFCEHLTATIRAASEAVMREAGRPVMYLRDSSASKEQIAQSIRERDGIEAGPVCLLSAVEPLWSYEIRRDRASQHLVLVPRTRKCLHLYHYWIDEQVGMMHVRLATWLPLNVRVCLDGREWLCRMLDQRGVAYVRHDNCLSSVSDLAVAQHCLEQQLTSNWPALLDRVVSRVHPAWRTALTLEGRPLEYYWSLEQSEWASDLMFRDHGALAEVYPQLIRQGITTLGCDNVLRFLGRRIDRRFQGEVQADLRGRAEGVRLKHSVNHNSVKMYDKQGSVLRVETTIHNPRDLRVYRGTEAQLQKKQWRPLRKGVADLHRRAQVSQAANQRYLAALGTMNLNPTLAQALTPICKPRQHHGKRHRALRPMHEPDSQLLRAVADGRWTLNGFRNADIRKGLFGTDPTDPTQRRRRSGRVTRMLGLLHAHGLIRKIPRTRRWQITAQGRLISSLLQAAADAPLDRLLAA